MEAFPDAKVLLSVRDPERWYESTLTSIYSLSKTLRDLNETTPATENYLVPLIAVVPEIGAPEYFACVLLFCPGFVTLYCGPYRQFAQGDYCISCYG